jgi:hypothetical protein
MDQNDPEAAERGRVGVINLLAFKWFFSHGNGRVTELGHSLSALSPRPPEPSHRQIQRREHLAAASPETRHDHAMARGLDAGRQPAGLSVGFALGSPGPGHVASSNNYAAMPYLGHAPIRRDCSWPNPPTLLLRFLRSRQHYGDALAELRESGLS